MCGLISAETTPESQLNPPPLRRISFVPGDRANRPRKGIPPRWPSSSLAPMDSAGTLFDDMWSGPATVVASVGVEWRTIEGMPCGT